MFYIPACYLKTQLLKYIDSIIPAFSFGKIDILP